MEGVYSVSDHTISRFNLDEYINLLLKKQGAARVENRVDADMVLVMEKAEADNQISLIDSDFFLGEK